MILFLRGLPTSGKTTISNILAEKLQWEVIHVDEFKKEYMKQNPNANFIKEVVPASYKETLDKLQNYKTTNVIIEEVFRNKDFVQSIVDSCNENKIANQWFKILRDRKFLLELNDERKRKIKNTPEILDMMEQQMNSIKINGEVDVKNENIEESIRVILQSI